MSTISYVANKHEVMELGHRVMKAENEIDFSAVAAVSGDVCQVLKIPAEAKVNRADIIIKTPEGAAVSVDYGDDADPNGWNDAVSMNAAAGVLASPVQGTDAYAYGRFHIVANTLDLVIGAGGLSTAVIIVSAEYTLIERYAVT